VIPEFSAQAVTGEVLAHLERRRPAIVSDPAQVQAEVATALVPIRRAYLEAELPKPYFDALEREIKAAVPARWRNLAAPFSQLEQREFGLWRGGDVVARIVYVFIGLAVGGLCVELPFIPIWEKWFPFALAGAAWWLPNLQVWFRRRRYARGLGDVARTLGSAQLALERTVSNEELLGETEHKPELEP
jgi:hypothetical protein